MRSSLEMILMVFLMAFITYLLRVIPLVFIRKKIKSKFFYSFTYYIPYAVLSAMTFPYILFATNNIVAGIVGTVVAIISSIKIKSLIIVASISSLSVFIINLIYMLI